MEYNDIKISSIKIIENIRQRPSQDSVNELMQSIKQDGLMQPIGVQLKDSEYILIWGFRRLEACKKLGWKTIPTNIIKEDMSEDEFLIMNANENVQRHNITVSELGRICDHLGSTMTASEIAAKLSISTSRVKGALDVWKNVPKALRDKIKVFQAGEKEAQGMLGLASATTILRMRGITQAQRDRIFEWARRHEVTSPEICTLGHLIKNGMSVEASMLELENWKPITMKIIVNKEVYEQSKADYISNVNMFNDAINNKFPGLAFQK